ncbi:YihY/virulence factor BrkB family protein [Ramlibacter sp. USB13]|uniref:YihY/virulence factor BrkB family protein n=1 Tax=Ramlibacter cellulosilyticus TaxID=2764187 RepID=A0A923MNU0_9BURK|nr:YihY/virulence factor BrkB family protein [Ramlibacter cellulosilyticus]MBC5782513.1 YihY/virulence factor BrkB family protein [Ramlibacter cellulosilyticus]
MALIDHVPAGLKRAVQPLKPLLRALHLWSGAGGMRMSAAMSFYGILSLAPLLLAIVGILGWWMDRAVLESGLLKQLGAVIGDQGASIIKQALASAQEPSEGITASIAGFVVLLFGATGVFGELQNAFELVWSQGRGLPPKQSWKHTASLRLRGVGYILVFGFMLLVSLVVSTVLTLFTGWAGDRLPMVEVLARVLNEVIGFVVGAALFTGLMRLSGGPKPRLRFLVFGGCVAAILFTMGRQLLTLYLSTAAVVSTYGAAGSLIVLLMWIYFSSAVLLFGAACARALEENVAEKKGVPEVPKVERRKGERRRVQHAHT